MFFFSFLIISVYHSVWIVWKKNCVDWLPYGPGFQGFHPKHTLRPNTFCDMRRECNVRVKVVQIRFWFNLIQHIWSFQSNNQLLTLYVGEEEQNDNIHIGHFLTLMSPKNVYPLKLVKKPPIQWRRKRLICSYKVDA